MSAFAQWLIGFARSFLTWLYNNGIDLLQGAIDGFCTFILSIVALLPSTPVPTGAPAIPSSSAFTVFLSTLNWIFPVAYFLSILGFITAAMVLYASYMVIGRWLKLYN